jgi:hypothetical protein
MVRWLTSADSGGFQPDAAAEDVRAPELHFNSVFIAATVADPAALVLIDKTFPPLSESTEPK